MDFGWALDQASSQVIDCNNHRVTYHARFKVTLSSVAYFCADRLETPANLSKLTNEEVEFYKKNGYLLYEKQLFSPEKLAELTDIFEDQLKQKGNKLSDEPLD